MKKKKKKKIGCLFKLDSRSVPLDALMALMALMALVAWLPSIFLWRFSLFAPRLNGRSPLSSSDLIGGFTPFFTSYSSLPFPSY